MNVDDLRELTIAKGIGTTEQRQRLDRSKGYAEPFLELLGAQRIESLDASGYEQATIIHDLNTPVPSSMHGRFSCVIDGGTIEHVFNFPNAIRSCMEMLEPGGHYIGITPANNHLGHGFYQFSPELYYRVLGAENGFEVRTMLVKADSHWYQVADPAVLHERTELVSSAPVTLVVIARRNKVMERFHTPQQSDYVSAWSPATAATGTSPTGAAGEVRDVVRKVLPTGLKTRLRQLLSLTRKREDVPGLGTVDARHFKRIDLL